MIKHYKLYYYKLQTIMDYELCKKNTEGAQGLIFGASST